MRDPAGSTILVPGQKGGHHKWKSLHALLLNPFYNAPTLRKK